MARGAFLENIVAPASIGGTPLLFRCLRPYRIKIELQYIATESACLIFFTLLKFYEQFPYKYENRYQAKLRTVASDANGEEGNGGGGELRQFLTGDTIATTTSVVPAVTSLPWPPVYGAQSSLRLFSLVRVRFGP